MMEKTHRWAALDNLRSLVIFLVVVMHSNVTYSGMGGWYYKEGSPERLDVVSKVFFGLYGTFTQAWFMGILFFLAAFFAAQSLGRKGTGRFVRERLFRLGLPLLVFVFVVQPLTVYFLWNDGQFFHQRGWGEFYLGYLTSGSFIGGTGPLWFVEALLIFCLVYALVRHLRPGKIWEGPARPPRTGTFLGLIALVGTGAFLIRLVWPVGSDVANLQLGFFASYIVLFILGIHQGERGWKLSPEGGLAWFKAALGLGLPLWVVLMVAGGALQGDIPLSGGPHWQSLYYAFWEAFVALAMTLGLPAFFEKYGAGTNRLTTLAARENFRIYMFHAPVLIGLSLALAFWQAPPLAKHLVVAPLAYLATLGVAVVLGKVPGLGRISR